MNDLRDKGRRKRREGGERIAGEEKNRKRERDVRSRQIREVELSEEKLQSRQTPGKKTLNRTKADDLRLESECVCGRGRETNCYFYELSSSFFLASAARWNTCLIITSL